MSYSINLEEVDTDGAIREAAEQVAGDTRLSFLKKAGVAGGAALSGGAVLGALAGPAMAAGRPPAKFGKGDIGVLNFALTLEYLEAAFYNEATNGGHITSPQLRSFLQVVTIDENRHVGFLKGALGRKAIKKPKFDFKGIPNDQNKFAATAFVLENTGVHAYLGQAPNLTPAHRSAAETIATVEARHAGVIGLINQGRNGISPSGAFDTGWSASRVLKAVASTGFIK